MSLNSVEEREFSSFKEFAEFAFPHEGIFNPLEHYVFRGESAEFPLLPTILRPGVLEKLINRLPIMENQPFNQWTQIKAEMELIRNFYIEADMEGLFIPEIPLLRKDITQPFWSDIEAQRRFVTEKGWVPEELHEITGIGQHYGLPTRFIDWSYRLTTSLLFASLGVMRHYGGMLSRNYKAVTLDKENSSRLFFIIWALDTAGIKERSNGEVDLIRPIYTTNANLTAQKGLFTTRKFVSIEDDKITFDQFVNDKVNRSESFDNRAALYRFKIPQRDAGEAFFYLERLGISEKTLFPGFGGVANHVKWMNNI
ncbi:FRG domain-containing protein [Niabella sp. 22666]|uniref:FRG domain-containing protein n=1 Tax=Niabella sp. 22666 TaxID=3453954 RepID=UPI003F835F53